MTEGGEAVSEPAAVSLTKTPQKARRQMTVWAVVGSIVAVTAGVTLWVWAPWVDRSPFTAYQIGMQDEEYTVPGSTPGSCVRTAGSEEESVIYDEDGNRLAAGRDEREGERLGPEFGDWAGDCLFVARIDDVPGGLGTYLIDWGGGGDRHEIAEEDLRLSVEAKRENLTTAKKPKS
ncbi:hypothetical protein [Streptomyces flavidovirens]|uniref:Uncharacterized protein n=1 Tax=Streptomyces flavidovirens TaxID=67298 RepID=A0ABW6R8M9_9ACTN